jgi:hypothetical protein
MGYRADIIGAQFTVDSTVGRGPLVKRIALSQRASRCEGT